MRSAVILTLALASLGCSSNTPDASPSDADVDATTDGISDATTDGISDAPATETSPDAPATTCAIDALQAKYRSGATEIDFDCNGTVDWRLTRDGAGKVTKETVDFNGDGKLDYEVDRGASLQTVRVDSNFDGKWDLVIERKSGTAAGTFDFVEQIDPTLRLGTLTFRRRYTLPLNPFTVIEESLQTDGSWKEERKTTANWPTRKIDAAIGGSAGACSDADKAKIEKALEDVEKSIECLGGYDKSLSRRAKWMLAANNVSIFCKPEATGGDKFCASANDAHRACLFGICGTDLTIQVTPEGLNAPECGALSSTLFHELMHYVSGLHRVGDGSLDKNDPVYGCERLCGAGEATPENCAACLQTSTGDERCVKAGGKPRECKQEVAGRCNCASRQKTYPTYTQCTVECPSGLGCSFAGCTEIKGPPICEKEDVECTCGCCDDLVCDPVSKKCVPK